MKVRNDRIQADRGRDAGKQVQVEVAVLAVLDPAEPRP